MESGDYVQTLRAARERFARGSNRYMYIVGIVLGLTIWQIAGYLLPDLSFEPFTDVVAIWYGFLTDGSLVSAILTSLQHTVIGFVLAVIIGIPLGFLMGRKEEVYWALDGPLNALYATPIVALTPLLAVWVGLGLVGKVVIVFIMAFIELTVNIFQGVRDVSDSYNAVAESFGASRIQTYRTILIPAILPFLFAGLRLSIGRAVRGMIVAELFLAVNGIGELLVAPANRYSVGAQLALIGTVTLLGIIAQSTVQQIRGQLVHWPTGAGRGE